MIFDGWQDRVVGKVDEELRGGPYLKVLTSDAAMGRNRPSWQ